jgi:hypothetical protein
LAARAARHTPFSKSLRRAVRPHRLFKLFWFTSIRGGWGIPYPAGIQEGFLRTCPSGKVYYFGPEWISKQATQDNIKQARKILVKPKNDLALKPSQKTFRGTSLYLRRSLLARTGLD